MTTMTTVYLNECWLQQLEGDLGKLEEAALNMIHHRQSTATTLRGLAWGVLVKYRRSHKLKVFGSIVGLLAWLIIFIVYLEHITTGQFVNSHLSAGVSAILATIGDLAVIKAISIFSSHCKKVTMCANIIISEERQARIELKDATRRVIDAWRDVTRAMGVFEVMAPSGTNIYTEVDSVNDLFGEGPSDVHFYYKYAVKEGALQAKYVTFWGKFFAIFHAFLLRNLWYIFLFCNSTVLCNMHMVINSCLKIHGNDPAVAGDILAKAERLSCPSEHFVQGRVFRVKSQMMANLEKIKGGETKGNGPLQWAGTDSRVQVLYLNRQSMSSLIGHDVSMSGYCSNV